MANAGLKPLTFSISARFQINSDHTNESLMTSLKNIQKPGLSIKSSDS